MISITRDDERLTIALPHSKGDPCVSCGVHLAKVKCTPEGALDLCRQIARALGREDVVNLCHKENADG